MNDSLMMESTRYNKERMATITNIIANDVKKKIKKLDFGLLRPEDDASDGEPVDDTWSDDRPRAEDENSGIPDYMLNKPNTSRTGLDMENSLALESSLGDIVAVGSMPLHSSQIYDAKQLESIISNH